MRKWKYVCLLLLLCVSPLLLGDACDFEVYMTASDPEACGGTVSPTHKTFDSGNSVEQFTVTLGGCRSFSLECTSGCSNSLATVSGTTIAVEDITSQIDVSSSYTITFYADCSGEYSETCVSLSSGLGGSEDPVTSSGGTPLIEEGECIEGFGIECLDENDVYPEPEPELTPSVCLSSGAPSGGNPANCCSGAHHIDQFAFVWVCN